MPAARRETARDTQTGRKIALVNNQVSSSRMCRRVQYHVQYMYRYQSSAGGLLLYCSNGELLPAKGAALRRALSALIFVRVGSPWPPKAQQHIYLLASTGRPGENRIRRAGGNVSSAARDRQLIDPRCAGVGVELATSPPCGFDPQGDSITHDVP